MQQAPTLVSGTVSRDTVIDLLRRLIKDAGRKIYLLLDKLRVHHSKPVKAWLAERKHEIEVFYLPSYRPELNPNEIANADLKRAVTKLAPARTKLQLVKATARPLCSVQRQPNGSKAASSITRFGCGLSSMLQCRVNVTASGLAFFVPDQ